MKELNTVDLFCGFSFGNGGGGGKIEPYGLTIYRPFGGLCYKPRTYDEYWEACKLNRERSRELN